MEVFESFFTRLQRRASKNQAFNPYKNPHLLHNLKLYFEYLYDLEQDHIILIGEAPGYKGCRLTGIPFSSAELIQTSSHKLFTSIRDKVILEQIEGENTAKIVWNELQKHKITPILWNTFPFHPYFKYKQFSNRAPTAKEIQEGSWYIKKLINIFQPRSIAAVGKKGQLALQKVLPNSDIAYIRHPSYGGKADFILHINSVINNHLVDKEQRFTSSHRK